MCRELLAQTPWRHHPRALGLDAFKRRHKRGKYHTLFYILSIIQHWCYHGFFAAPTPGAWLPREARPAPGRSRKTMQDQPAISLPQPAISLLTPATSQHADGLDDETELDGETEEETRVVRERSCSNTTRFSVQSCLSVHRDEFAKCGNKRVNGRSHIVEERISTHSTNSHATSF